MSNLLPKDTKEFSSKDYWNSFFASRGNDPFEWYGQFTELYGQLHPYIRPSDNLLVAGCGNSSLSADLYRVGYKHITNADVSEVVVRQMAARHAAACPAMRWCYQDLTASTFSDASFSAVLDKGTLDAIYTDDSPEVTATVNKYLSEMCRVLRPGGRYVLVSLLQDHIARHLAAWCQDRGWMLRLYRCQEAERSAKDQGRFTLPVFMAICTKLNPMPGMQSVVESCLESSDGPPERVKIEHLLQRIQDLQQYSAVTHALLGKVRSGEEARMELCEGSSGAMRYVLFILDAPVSAKPALPMGVFIVPQRREVEWLFSSSEGRRQLVSSASAGRLVVVHLVRGQVYDRGLEQVQEELSPRIADLKPSSMPQGFKVPFLSVGGDVGAATRVCSGRSDWCGPYVVEDVTVDGGTLLRRLVFLDNPNVVQSEARFRISSKPVQSSSSKKKSGSKVSGGGTGAVLDHGYLSCSHHLAMVGGLGLVGREAAVLLVGLGGGPLAIFIHNNFNKVRVQAVELDPAMVTVARQWFGFKSGPRLGVTVMDGLEYCRRAAVQGPRYDVILLDVDSKDLSVGMSCPPQAFVDTPFLRILEACLLPRGVLIINVVCRDSAVWTGLVERVAAVFGRLLCQTVPHEVNRVLFCRRRGEEGGQRVQELEKKVKDCSFTPKNEEYGVEGSNSGAGEKEIEDKVVPCVSAEHASKAEEQRETKQKREQSDERILCDEVSETIEENSETNPQPSSQSMNGANCKKNVKEKRSKNKITTNKITKRNKDNQRNNALNDETNDENELMEEFSRSIIRMNNVLKPKNNGEDMMDVREILKFTVVL